MTKFFKNGLEKFCDYFYLNDNVERVLGGIWIGTGFVTIVALIIMFGIFLVGLF